jgi:hypothetical protein
MMMFVRPLGNLVMLVLNEDGLLARLNAAIEELRENAPSFMDDAEIKAHATRTVVEEIEVKVYKMLDRAHWQQQEMINKI